MTEFLLFAPVVISVLLGAVFRRPQEWRACIVLYAIGGGAGATLFVVASSAESWRTVTLGPDSAIAGAAIACSFLLAAVLDLRTDRWMVPTLIGVAGTAMTLAVSNEWLVPGLLFWTCSTLALATIGSDVRQRASLWVTLFLSGRVAVRVPSGLGPVRGSLEHAGVAGGLDVLRGARRGRAPGRRRPVLRAVADAGFPGCRGSSDRRRRRVRDRGTIRVRGSAARSGFARGPCAGRRAVGNGRAGTPFGVMASWPVALLLGAALASPSAVTAAALGAIVATSLFALWPQASSVAPARAIVLAFVPPGVGFWAVLAAATYSFGRLIEAPDVLEETSWVVVSALLPFAVAAAVSVGARVARARGVASLQPAVVASWGLLAVSLGAGLWPETVLDLNQAAVPDPSRTGLLFGGALVLGAVGGWFARKRDWGGRAPVTEPPRHFRRYGPTLSRRWLQALDWTALDHRPRDGRRRRVVHGRGLAHGIPLARGGGQEAAAFLLVITQLHTRSPSLVSVSSTRGPFTKPAFS